MMRVAVLTDSATDLPQPSLGHGVTVVALQGSAQAVGAAAGPLVDDFTRAYERLALEHDAVLSILSSSRLTEAVDAARAARAQLRGVVPIEIVDSGAACIQLGFVVRRVARRA